MSAKKSQIQNTVSTVIQNMVVKNTSKYSCSIAVIRPPEPPWLL